ncbi:MAG: hypothetical protein IPO65_04775 [Saprospiraceae bacterium]|nr:hypothetical protein [Saprospiraceae bacterium]MBK9687085.1 hypothetical protein [Saprospiraceae bacterium]
MRWQFNFIKLAFLGFITAFLIHAIPVGCNKDEEPPVEDPTSTLDLTKANKAAEDAEQAFASGEVAKILPFMAPVALERSQLDLEAADAALLKQFAKDFNNRSVVGYGDEFIEYQFDWNGLPYTVDFAIQEDGSIKIIRL